MAVPLLKIMPRYHVKVIPRSSKNQVEEIHSDVGAPFMAPVLKVKLTAPPVEGKANAQLIAVLADYFKVKKRQVRILQGEAGRNKIVEVDM